MTYAPRPSSAPIPVDRDASATATRFLHRPIVFQEPDRVVAPASWLDFTPFAFWIVDALRPATFVELGCHSGNSYAAFAQAVQLLGLPTTCYGVDTWQGDPHAGLYDEQVFEEWSAYHDRRFSTFSRLVRATFDEAVQQFSSGSIDLLHIDGYHTFDAVSHDFDAWRPKLSARGVVLCHDIDVRERDFGAWRLWERLRDEYPSFDFRHGHGLGVLGIGHDLPDPLRWLFSLRSGPPETAQLVRLFFSRLGAAVLGRFEAVEAHRVRRREIATREEALAHAAAVADLQRADLAETERRLSASAHRVAKLRHALRTTHAMLATRAAETERLVWQVRSGETQIEALTRDLEQRDDALRAADTRARELDGEAAALLERVRRDTSGLHEERTRRRGLDALVSWSRHQVLAAVAALSNRSGDGFDGDGSRDGQGRRIRFARGARRARAVRTWRETSRDFAAVRASIGTGPSAFTQTLRLASMPDGLRAFLAIEGSGLFHEAWYMARNPDVATRGMHPLVHGLTIGAAAGCDPHPLFSIAHYLDQVGDLIGPGEHPLYHYLTRGWRAGCSPHPLFDATYYLAHNVDVAHSGANPLGHYLEHGAAERRNPHPLFDSRFYLQENPDVLDTGMEPLTHFIVKGAQEGRSPHPLFDSIYYLDTYRDVAEDTCNPLEHFLTCGWREGRNPSAAFDVEHYLQSHPDVRASGENPLVHYVLYGRAQGRQALPNPRSRAHGDHVPGTSRIALTASTVGSGQSQDDRRTILFVSHVGPWRPRAGNEFRVHRMLRWYRQRGYRVVPIIAPLPGEELTREGIEGVAAACGNVVHVHRDGRIEYVLHDMPDVLASLTGTFTSSFGDLLNEEDGPTDRARELLNLERTFCHDALIATVLHLQRSLGPHILQVEYIWMTRLLPLVRGQVLKVVDTHDVLSSIEQKVRMFGLRDVTIGPEEEADRLRRADLAIAIQDDERAELTRLAPSVPVITAGVDFDIVDDHRPSIEGRLLFVASNNVRNRKGLDDFIRLAWPRIRQRLPHAELRIVGSVAQGMEGQTVPGVKVLGLVDDLTAEYLDAAAVINPVVAGTGLKIKMLEALCHLRPIVTWPTGVDGLDPTLAGYCRIARDWYEFAERVIDVLTASANGGFTAEDRAVIADRIASERVYASLDAAYREFFERVHEPARREAVHAGD